MTWSEILYEEEDKYKYCQYSYGPIVKENGFEDIEYICEIPKTQKNQYNFLQLTLILKNLKPVGNMEKFEKFLKERNVVYKNHIWQKPLLD